MMFQCFSYAGGSQFHHELRCTTWNSLAGDDTTSSSRLRLTLLLCALSLGPMSAIGKQEYLDEMTYRQIASNSTYTQYTHCIDYIYKLFTPVVHPKCPTIVCVYIFLGQMYETNI